MSSRVIPQKKHRFEYTPEWAGKRLKLLVRELIPELSSRDSLLVIANGLIGDGATEVFSDADTVMPEGAVLIVDLRHGVRGEGRRGHKLLADRMEVKYDDDQLVVVAKAAWLLVQPTEDESLNKGVHGGPPLVELLKHYWKSTHKPIVNPILVQRLDMQTSGLLVLAKTAEAAAHLQRQLKPPRKLGREYVALVAGKFQDKKGTWISHLGRGKLGLRQTMLESNQKPRPGQEVQLAETHFDVVQSFEDATLLHLKLETGRTHQIRIHCAEAGHPVLGDELYERLAKITLERVAQHKLTPRTADHPAQEAVKLTAAGQSTIVKPDHMAKRVFLHATRLSFIHPATEKRMSFDEPLPDDMKAYLRYLENRAHAKK
ncbi:23S rRNA pseudouridine(1911/1915/1917) synthase RluD [soil metagenome]